MRQRRHYSDARQCHIPIRTLAGWATGRSTAELGKALERADKMRDVVKIMVAAGIAVDEWLLLMRHQSDAPRSV